MQSQIRLDTTGRNQRRVFVSFPSVESLMSKTKRTEFPLFHIRPPAEVSLMKLVERSMETEV